jgi:hypothetical protein
MVEFVSRFPGNNTLPTKVTEWNTPKRPLVSSGFYLNGVDGYPDGRYLTTDPENYYLGMAIPAER